MLTINAPREHTFAEPLGLLGDCHRRIEKFLEQLLRVAEAGRGGDLPPDARRALETALRYFRQAAPWHTADEEASLFPRLRALAERGNERAERAVSVMASLEADHDAADRRHALIDELGTRWLEQGALPLPEVARWETELRGLRSFYAAHLALEDGDLFPLAGELLDGAAVEAIGREMAARRGVEFESPEGMRHCAERRGRTDSRLG